MQCFSFGSRKVSYTLLLRFILVRTLSCVFCLTNTGFVQCNSLGPRKVYCMLVLNFALFSNFCFCCNALPSAPVVCCTLLLLVIYVSCFLPHQLRACAVLFPSAPLKFTPFCFSLFNQFAFVMRALPNKLRFVQWFFPRLPSNFHALFFALYYLVLILCSAFFPSLIESSFDSCKVGSSLLLHGQSVRRVLFHSVYCGVIFSAPVDFESLCSPLHFSVIWYACFATRASSSVGLLPCPSVFAPLFSLLFFYSLVYVCYSFLAFSAVISHVFLPALPW